MKTQVLEAQIDSVEKSMVNIEETIKEVETWMNASSDLNLFQGLFVYLLNIIMAYQFDIVQNWERLFYFLSNVRACIMVN